MRQTQLENAVAQWFLFELAIGLIGMFIMLTILYFVIRWAVRDGMIDANRQQRHSRYSRTPELGDGLKVLPPDMRTD
jgi:UDP-N-acetylmuramyl pentapeptide phosphotransferase/UDP-N-acetylglucosamine-1-phosphate transferase